jgi:adenosylhomocysteinase
LDKLVADIKLQTLGVKIDRLTKEQQAYIRSWKEGT